MFVIMEVNLNKIGLTAWNFLMEYSPKILMAAAVLLIGLWIISKFTKLTAAVLKKRGLDESLGHFLKNLLGVALKVVLFISVADMVGIKTTSFIALLGAAGLAIGLALQGSLSNFAGGTLIMIFRPYKVGDLIECQGYLGTVKEIQVFNTILVSPENQTVILPNGLVSNGPIKNLTHEGATRVDLVVGIGYGEDIKQARDVIMGVMSNHELVLKDPAPSVNVLELADSSVNLAVRPFAKPQDYWAVYFDVLEKSKLALDAANIEIPFPQRVIHQG
jgi:small conductance mechanosensitive channel